SGGAGAGGGGALPETGTNDTIKLAAVAVAGVAGVAIASQFGLNAYRRSLSR
ncbi:MAG: hypothetical protein ACXWLH_05575, partial [Candidatus Saccharimonadales bacterium]